MIQDDDDQLEVPPVFYEARKGWTALGGSVQVTPVANRETYIPSHFEMRVQPSDAREGTRETVLLFLAKNDGITLAGVLSEDDEDVTVALKRLTKLGSVDWWKREALDQLAGSAIVEESIDKMDPDGDRSYRGITEENAASIHAETGRRMKEASAQIWGMPLSRRRNRVTDDLLLQVAKVYRDAWDAGQPPTKAVIAHFHVSPSTAGRWVGMARKIKGGLGPSDGTKGGVSDDEA